jgi:hypothetical protein
MIKIYPCLFNTDLALGLQLFCEEGNCHRILTHLFPYDVC